MKRTKKVLISNSKLIVLLCTVIIIFQFTLISPGKVFSLLPDAEQNESTPRLNQLGTPAPSGKNESTTIPTNSIEPTVDKTELINYLIKPFRYMGCDGEVIIVLLNNRLEDIEKQKDTETNIDNTKKLDNAKYEFTIIKEKIVGLEKCKKSAQDFITKAKKAQDDSSQLQCLYQGLNILSKIVDFDKEDRVIKKECLNEAIKGNYSCYLDSINNLVNQYIDMLEECRGYYKEKIIGRLVENGKHECFPTEVLITDKISHKFEYDIVARNKENFLIALHTVADIINGRAIWEDNNNQYSIVKGLRSLTFTRVTVYKENKKEEEIKHSAVIIDGYTYVPIEHIAKEFNLSYLWIEKEKILIIF
ncbi:stalk domain-containing protein [Pseudobacteroides cellulosolvens]|uniref:Copper amine oxidase-like domain-containing protein n=1 Tax=Pseudobacteroides cellulosolvens ATCC 35603 = DSM 2933 TaxID=398512 RepID=A0A0L6JIS3_9FIRM|nr:stalk domain-containing protein [Pseudobacteroides cellulosolvens]KNY25352.1 copper amine oxidase-like domain-containing protein [Pseudobacteroides cellulosolvens ATCC 35603 = DSM 2933]